MGFLSIMAISMKVKLAWTDDDAAGGSASRVRREPVRYEKPWSGRGGILSSSSNERGPKPRKDGGVRGPGKRSATDPDYDRWLDRKLHQIYDPVLRETIPDEMAKLLLQFEERPDGELDDEQNRD